MHGRRRMAIDPHILTMLGRSTSGFHRLSRYLVLLAPTANHRRVFDESHEG